jgi:stage V sporulation protein SpoVS
MFLLHIKDLPVNIQGAKMVLFADNTNVQIKATDEDTLNQQIKSYAAATNLVSCKWVTDKYQKNYSNVIPHTAERR